MAVYVKLLDGFYIAIPVGHYNPDWAIAFYEGTIKHIYFVAETKESMNSMQLRLIEEFNLSRKSPAFKSQRRKRWVGGLACVGSSDKLR